MKTTELPDTPVSPCVRIFIESLIKELAGTRCDQTLTLLGLEEELAVGGISGDAAEDDPQARDFVVTQLLTLILGTTADGNEPKTTHHSTADTKQKFDITQRRTL
jgi:hypothetical protein